MPPCAPLPTRAADAGVADVGGWWVLAKLVLTIVATALLLLHTQPIGHLGAVAAAGGQLGDDLNGMRIQLVVDAAAALVMLLGATVLAVVKPRGVTPGARRLA